MPEVGLGALFSFREASLRRVTKQKNQAMRGRHEWAEHALDLTGGGGFASSRARTHKNQHDTRRWSSLRWLLAWQRRIGDSNP